MRNIEGGFDIFWHGDVAPEILQEKMESVALEIQRSIDFSQSMHLTHSRSLGHLQIVLSPWLLHGDAMSSYLEKTVGMKSRVMRFEEVFGDSLPVAVGRSENMFALGGSLRPSEGAS